MTPITVGQKFPSVTLNLPGRTLDTASLTEGRTVVFFGLPGAFTPTCSSSHVPRYDELFSAFQDVGVDEVVCVSVNDDFVMQAWGRDKDVQHVTLLADGNGTLTDALGLLVDKDVLGFGKRSWRYAMVVTDGVVTHTFIEPIRDGDPYETSDADTVLSALGGTAPPDIVVVGREGCAYCVKAKAALTEAGLPFVEVQSNPRRLRGLSGRTTTPQVFVDGQHIGGSDDLAAWLKTR